MVSAIGFLTVLGRGRAPDANTFRWFPVAGAGVGAIVAVSLIGAREIWSLPLAAAVAVAVDLAVTGMLHADGLADSADGLLPHMDRQRRLDVMRQPDVGAFALAVVPTVLLIRFAAFASGQVEAWAVVAVWSLSRTLVAAVPTLVPYARPSGLASDFLGDARPWVLLGGLPALALLWWAQGVGGLGAGLATIVAAAAVVGFARARLGGFTGDVLGASILISETVALLVLAATR